MHDRSPYISKKKVAERYGTTPRTVDRWCAYSDLGFPARITINDRVYFSEPELIEFDRRRAAETMATRAALRGIARQHSERADEPDPPS